MDLPQFSRLLCKRWKLFDFLMFGVSPFISPMNEWQWEALFRRRFSKYDDGLTSTAPPQPQKKRYRAANDEDFRGFFGISPWVCQSLWEQIQACHCQFPNPQPLHLLCGLYLLKVYPTQTVARNVLGCSHQSWQTWSDLGLKYLASIVEVRNIATFIFSKIFKFSTN
ncbi:hypothetical protein DFJ73DRAFT_844496 [Zopfochytrium polystomum]|nr:hypothetical protein DFJ73DRAFT_844496 [Zopfochytrium polystomum]